MPSRREGAGSDGVDALGEQGLPVEGEDTNREHSEFVPWVDPSKPSEDT